MVNPLDYLMPGGHDLSDPDALARWMADTNQSQGGLVPDNDHEQESPFGQGEGLSSPQGEAQGQSQSQGQWGTWLQDPANRGFLLNFGVQLMSGGWGGWSENLSRAIAAGVQGGHAAETGTPMPGSGRGSQRPTGGPRMRTGGPRLGRGTRVGTPEIRAQAERAQLEQVQTFLQDETVTEAQWTEAQQEGGLLHRAGYVGRQFSERPQLIQHVQRRLHSLGRGRGEVSSEELLRLGQSQDPLDLADFDALSRRVYGNPGVGFRWVVTPEGRIDRAPLTGRGNGPGGRVGATAVQAGVDSATLTIGNIRGYVESQSAITGWSERTLSQLLNSGSYARLANSMLGAVAAFMHSRSGAQTSVREFENYVRQFMPSPGDSAATVYYKLAELELQVLLVARRAGEQISRERLLELHNVMRQQTGMEVLTPEAFDRILPRLQSEAGLPGSQGGPQGAPQTPPPGGQTPPSTPPPGGGQTQVPPSTPAPAQRPAWAADPPQNAPPQPSPQHFWRQIPGVPNGGVWMRAN